jgi:hypothetical protein
MWTSFAHHVAHIAYDFASGVYTVGKVLQNTFIVYFQLIRNVGWDFADGITWRFAVRRVERARGAAFRGECEVGREDAIKVISGGEWMPNPTTDIRVVAG